MIEGIYSSIAGVRTSGKKLANSAGNIANCNTDGYKKTDATITEDAVGLPDVTITRDATPGALIEEPDGVMRETSNVDLSQEMVQMMIARRVYQANTRALKVQNDALNSVLDILV
jgi:flagellar basal body rod protein FlgG